MEAWLLIAWMTSGYFSQSAAQGAQASRPDITGFASETRMFDMRSRQAWETVLKRLTEIGFPADSTDRANQVVLTKWRDVGDKGMEWLAPPTLPQNYVGRRMRFRVFVSPFAEPARIYVGSLFEATHAAIPARRATIYNASNLNRAVMNEIAEAVGQDGLPVPVDNEERRQLALSMLKDNADECLRQGVRATKGAKITPPQKISLSEFEILYPLEAESEKGEGTVQVEFSIFEDGGVSNIRILDPVPGRQLEDSARGAVSLLVYAPAKLDTCRVPTIMRYSVGYRFR